MKSYVYTKTFMRMFILTLFILSKNLEKVHVPINSKMDKLLYTQLKAVITCKNMNRSQKYNARCKKARFKKLNIVWFQLHDTGKK